MLHIIVCDVACLAIATMYYCWRDVYCPRMQRLSERTSDCPDFEPMEFAVN